MTLNNKHLQSIWALRILTILCLMIPLAFSRQTFDQFGTPKQLIFDLGCGLLFLFVLSNFKKLKNLPVYLRYALIIFILTQVFQTVRMLNPGIAIFGAYKYSESLLVQCGFIILFFSGYLCVEKESDFSNINLVLIISIYFTGIFGIYQYYLNDPITQTQITRVKSFFGDPNSFGVFLVLVLILAFHEFESKRKPWRRILAAGGIYIGITVLVLTFSRAAWLGFIISFVLYSLGMFAHCRKYKKPRADLKFLVISLVFIILGILSAELLTFIQPKPHTDYEIKARITSIVKGNDSGRGLLWLAAIRIFKSAPLLGYGINTFQDNFHYFQAKNAVNFWGPDRDLDQTHNELLHYLSTQGLLGLAAYLGLLLAILFAINPLKLFQPQDTAPARASTTVITLCSAITGYLVFVQFAYPLIHYSFLFWIYSGIAIRIQAPAPGFQTVPALPESKITENNGSGPLPYIQHPVKLNLTGWWKLAVILVLISGWGLIQYNLFTADTLYRKAFYQARYHHFPLALANYQKAISLNPWIDYYKFRYAITLNRAAKWELRKNTNITLAEKYTDEAKVLLHALMEKNPRHYQYPYLFGQIAEARHQYTEAGSYYQEALSLYPHNYKIIFRLAKIEKLRGNSKKAAILFNSGMKVDPGYMRRTAQKEAVLF